jgi:hypothetical protein
MNVTLADRDALSHVDLSLPRPKAMVIGFWTVTTLLCLQIGFTAYAQLRLPPVAEAFAHLGFPDYFRVELAWAKFLGVVLLLAPVSTRLKEWAYAGLPSPSVRRSSPTLRSATAPRRGAGRRPPACSGGSRTSSGAAFRPCRRDLTRLRVEDFTRGGGGRDARTDDLRAPGGR